MLLEGSAAKNPPQNDHSFDSPGKNLERKAAIIAGLEADTDLQLPFLKVVSQLVELQHIYQDQDVKELLNAVNHALKVFTDIVTQDPRPYSETHPESPFNEDPQLTAAISAVGSEFQMKKRLLNFFTETRKQKQENVIEPIASRPNPIDEKERMRKQREMVEASLANYPHASFDAALNNTGLDLVLPRNPIQLKQLFDGPLTLEAKQIIAEKIRLEYKDFGDDRNKEDMFQRAIAFLELHSLPVEQQVESEKDRIGKKIENALTQQPINLEAIKDLLRQLVKEGATFERKRTVDKKETITTISATDILAGVERAEKLTQMGQPDLITEQIGFVTNLFGLRDNLRAPLVEMSQQVQLLKERSSSIGDILKGLEALSKTGYFFNSEGQTISAQEVMTQIKALESVDFSEAGFDEAEYKVLDLPSNNDLDVKVYLQLRKKWRAANKNASDRPYPRNDAKLNFPARVVEFTRS